MAAAYPPSGEVVPFGPGQPQLVPSRRTDLGCHGVADGRFRGLAERLKSKEALQIAGRPQESRIPDLRRAARREGTAPLIGSRGISGVSAGRARSFTVT